MAANFRKLSSSLSVLHDTCSVYRVTTGGRSLLIDCGTGVVPGADAVKGAEAVDRLLLTHFHRDSCSAAHVWQQHGAEVLVPFAERRFFEEADLLKASYDTYDNYTSYYPGFTSLHDLVADGYAHDYEALDWHGLRIDVVPLPGHTFGSVGYLFELDGRRHLACGDLMSAPGRLRDYFWSQWRYMDFTGHINHIESLQTVADLDVDLLLPGHGEPFEPTAQALAGLQRRLEELYELFYDQPYRHFAPQFRRLSEHVHEVTNSAANTYVVRDDDGHALLIDCGYTSKAPISANPHRFVDHLTSALESELGIRTVEWFLPSHYHDDHMAGYPALAARYGTRLVASPELRDILEHPDRYDMPCLVPRGAAVSHVVERGDAFHWRGIDFFVEQHPGQTLYHHLIWFDVDGRRYLCIGDNVSGLSFREERDLIHSFIPKNRTPATSYRDMPRQILERQPHTLLTGHGGAIPFDRAQVTRWQIWMDRWQELFADIIDQPHPTLGMDPRWVQLYPYKVRVTPGAEVKFELRVTNHESEPRVCAFALRSLEGVRLTPARGEVAVPAGSTATAHLTAMFPQAFRTHALPIVADVTWNGRHLGEIAEAIAYW